jgi:hypothetical protein
MRKTSIDLESVMQSDRQFFEDNPHQKSYTREIHSLEIIEARQKGVCFDFNYRVIVTEISPGTRTREIYHPDQSHTDRGQANNNKKSRREYKGFARDNKKSASK